MVPMASQFIELVSRDFLIRLAVLGQGGAPGAQVAGLLAGKEKLLNGVWALGKNLADGIEATDSDDLGIAGHKLLDKPLAGSLP